VPTIPTPRAWWRASSLCRRSKAPASSFSRARTSRRPLAPQTANRRQVLPVQTALQCLDRQHLDFHRHRRLSLGRLRGRLDAPGVRGHRGPFALLGSLLEGHDRPSRRGTRPAWKWGTCQPISGREGDIRIRTLHASARIASELAAMRERVDELERELARANLATGDGWAALRADHGTWPVGWSSVRPARRALRRSRGAMVGGLHVAWDGLTRPHLRFPIPIEIMSRLALAPIPYPDLGRNDQHYVKRRRCRDRFGSTELWIMGF
jgi:hypothetical protein